jgi:hypothetical protein
MLRKIVLKSLCAIILLAIFHSGFAQNQSDTLRLFLIGNSFSQNAGRYLPQLAQEGNHPLIIGRAEIGGCSLQKHWELAELAEKDPNDPKGKPYKGKSLRMLLSEGKWDVVTIQQNSMNSADPATYRPYARKLYDFIKLLQPNARVVMHQTWAYRSDSKDFSQVAANQFAKNEKEMWQKSRAAYRSAASELGIEIMPVGDAFWKVSSGKQGFRKDPAFDEQKAVYPALPVQKNSLHQGYYWDKNKKIVFDSHHANEAGCFLGSLVWYTFLFDESPEKLTFTPQGVPADFGQYLKKVARKTVK